MDAYEFTRFETNFECSMKAQYYEASVVAMKAINSFEHATNFKEDYRENEDYLECKDVFIDTTMSCTEEEAIGWMEHYMSKAIAYGIQTRNLDWKFKFLAAYDLFNSLCSKGAAV